MTSKKRPGRHRRPAVPHQAALRRSARRFAAAFQCSPDAIVISSLADGTLLEVNDATLRMSGYTRAELLGRNATDLLYWERPEDRERFVAALRSEGRLTGLESRFRTKSGALLDGLLSAELIQVGGEPQVLTVARDVTASRRAEVAIRESRERLLQAERVARVGFLDWDLPTGRIVLSDEACELTGYRPEGGLTTPQAILGTVHPDDRALVQERLAAALRDEKPYDIVYRHLRPDGAVVWVHAQAELTRRPDGEPTRLLGTIADITEVKRTEDALRTLNAELEQRVAERTRELAARNEELETFTYSVSHDLKAPLRGLDGYSRLLLEDHAAGLDEEGKAFLLTIRQAAQNMSQLIDDLLDYSRLERRVLQRGPLDLPALVADAVAEREEEIAQRGVAVQVAALPPAVTADAEGLAQAVRNLLDNALKFTRATSQPVIEIGGREAAGAVVLWVRDNGVGFEMRFHDRIFEIFQRLHRSEDYPGTGIGLAIVRKALERMGGRAWAESAPGKGATFWLELPR